MNSNSMVIRKVSQWRTAIRGSRMRHTITSRQPAADLSFVLLPTELLDYML